MTEITVESLTADLERVAKLAEAVGDFSAAVDAIVAIARLHGLYVERRIVEHVNMTPEAAGAALLRQAGRRLRVVR